MESSITMIIVVFFGMAVGSILGYYARQTIAKKQLHTAEGKVANLIENAEKESQEILLEAKNKAVNILEETKKKEQERENQIMRLEERLGKREELLDGKMEEIERGRLALEKKAEEIRHIRREVDETKIIGTITPR